MTTHVDRADDGGRRLTAADIQSVAFSRGSRLRPGYTDTEVDRFVQRLAQEFARLVADKAELRDQVRALQAQVNGAVAHEAPSDQAVRMLSIAQQTADNYVAEAEDFSRQMTSDAKAQYEERLREARENAGGIMQAAQEAAAKISADGGLIAAPVGQASTEELEEQVAYLKAFAQACRVQLRSYLEALIGDVETEWGRAHPAALPQEPIRTAAQRATRSGAPVTPATFHANAADDAPPKPAESAVPAVVGSRTAT